MLPTPKPLVKLGLPFIQLLEVESTNNYAHNLIQQGLATNGTVIIAQCQTKGKGQMGKKWQANAGENIFFSIILDISTVHLQNQFALVAIAALGSYHFFKKYAGNATAIKWSNDIYFNDNKAGGILIETTPYQQTRWAVVGIGINVNQSVFDSNLPNPISLQQITGTTYNINQLVIELCQQVEIHYNLLLNNCFDELLAQYNAALYKKNQQVTLKKDNIKFTCIINNVNAFGELQVSNGLKDSFGFGEVQWVL
ncbi:MAG: biotin--[acetyl-CoA-carboxylase] ligase [Bacteroidetes bacterium]|nr:biotin--[acetyl-CoA-carboxylase] ligase [Bacteroidota bacterium]